MRVCASDAGPSAPRVMIGDLYLRIPYGPTREIR